MTISFVADLSRASDYDVPSDDYGHLDESSELPIAVPYLNISELPKTSLKELAEYRSNICSACRQNPSTVIFSLCGHACLCSECSAEFTKDECLLCRGKSDRVTIRFS